MSNKPTPRTAVGRTMSFYLSSEALLAVDEMCVESGCRSKSLFLDDLIKTAEAIGGLEKLKAIRYKA